ncbi:MAG: response regulator [Candidatus Aureabacteria bacterium]|nr:response regulator [Candidatus Auribacterota bacterium]
MKNHSYNILVVDDDEGIRTIFTDYARELGYSVMQAVNGKEGLELCRENDFDVILTDIRMPVMGGIEFLQKLTKKNKNSVKIMMSGEAGVEEIISGFKEKIDDFIIKPFSSLVVVWQIIERQLEKLKLQRELEFKNSIMERYNEILQFLISSKDPKELFSYIYYSLQNLIPINQMELSLLDSERERLTIKYLLTDRKPVSHLGDQVLLKYSGFTPMLKSKEIQLISNLENGLNLDKRPFLKNALKEGMKSVLTFPLIVEENVYGFISFFSENPDSYYEKHIQLLKGIVPKISVSFEKALYQGRLSEENTFLRSSLKNLTTQITHQQEALIFSLAELTEKRCRETGQHLLRMQQFSSLIACALFPAGKKVDLGYGSRDAHYVIDMIRKTSPLHDIGKVGIPDSILLKPGKLSELEFEIIKTHTSIGAQCLEKAMAKVEIADYLLIGKDIAYCHHEKWAGHGYPNGLKGPDIPIAARIIALADVYDSLRSFRVYKQAWDHDSTCEYIREEKGRHFDPNIVDVFFDREKDFEQTFQRYCVGMES